MIDPKQVAAFFDRLAPSWDAGMVKNPEIIGTILDNAGVSEGKRVLDVACGTGVLIPDYLDRRVASVTAVDLSPEMARIAYEKFAAEPNVTVLCADVLTAPLSQAFDCIVVYNALPHFADPKRLIAVLSGLLPAGGTLTVAHGMSREALLRHHRNVPETVSEPLPPVEALAEIFQKHLTVTTVLSDDRMVQVVGKKV